MIYSRLSKKKRGWPISVLGTFKEKKIELRVKIKVLGVPKNMGIQ